MVFFTTFSVQHKQIKDIFQKHWNVLKNDYILGPTLPDRAEVTYRGAPSLRGKIAANVLDPPVLALMPSVVLRFSQVTDSGIDDLTHVTASHVGVT